MDCADCTLHVKSVIGALPGVDAVVVYLASEKAVVSLPLRRDVMGVMFSYCEGYLLYALRPRYT